MITKLRSRVNKNKISMRQASAIILSQHCGNDSFVHDSILG